ncbi:DNA primase [Candidatus Parvarchaeota archaeon]|nr:DNA primase [Candidatus Parvarchaeota archaeon]
MGKTYIDTVKYLVYASVDIEGLVEKPDVVGAIFGQTEGLLGDELDLRDLQKNGRIGRIEVDLTPRGGRSVGKIKLPSSLDMVETCILASALETVDRIGPCEAKIAVEKVEDTRNAKRKVLVERAKTLLKNLLLNELPESREISEMVRQEVKVAEISDYGEDKLPCGPGIEKYNEIIIVEGRADVLNLLKNDITNVIAVGGANVGGTIAKLAKEKEVTVFLDGDRGGDIILNELSNVAEIDFVARAPSGKEVEELARKELIKCLRGKVPFEQAAEEKRNGEAERRGRRFEGRYDERRPDRFDRRERGARQFDRPREGQQGDAPQVSQFESAQAAAPRQHEAHQFAPRHAQAIRPKPEQQAEAQATRQEQQTQLEVAQEPQVQRQDVQQDLQQAPLGAGQAVMAQIPEALTKSLAELENTLQARFYDAGLGLLKEVPIRDMYKTLEAESSVHAVVFDGIVTQRFADLAEKKGVKAILGAKMGNVFRKPEGVNIQTKN